MASGCNTNASTVAQTNCTFEPKPLIATASGESCDISDNSKDGGLVLDGESSKPQTCTNEITHDHQGGNDDLKNDLSTLSTAFTISFEDETANSPKKLFGIRDSIRKFAPPKPNTIEKPRSKPEPQDNSYMSIESAPGGFSKQFFNRSCVNNTSSRSSGRKSDSSRHSNISESAAFLIDKMLNYKQGESLSSIYLENESCKARSQNNRSKSGSAPKNPKVRSSDEILDDDIDDEVDFCEDKSDNGTYIVGAEPESDAARKKIDELFGVVKAAEASIIAASDAKYISRGPATVMRQSRLPDKRPMNRERQEHINRLATVRNVSRSSSSSDREIGSAGHRPRSATRQPHITSCDSVSKLPSRRSRRAASQSSRHSSHRGQSDGDTQSSRSSLQPELTENLDLQVANNPSLKFNRAFALRRARLGLGEPSPKGRLTSTPTSGQEAEAQLSPRRLINSSVPRYTQPANSSGQQNLSRSDGGRYSLRMKNVAPQNRLGSQVTSVRVTGHQSAIIDSYANKVYGHRPSPALTRHISPIHHSSLYHAPTIMPYQSSDEHDIPTTSRFKNTSSRSSGLRQQRKMHIAGEVIEGEGNYAVGRFNSSLGVEQELNHSGDGRDSSGRRVSYTTGQLGALDCLVISAISSLTMKIRGSVCDLMVDHAKKLPIGNETRSIVEEILPQLTASSSRSKSPMSIEEIDQSLYFELAQTLKNLKKVEQMVDVMKLIANQVHPSSGVSTSNNNASRSPEHTSHNNASTKKTEDAVSSNTNSETNSPSP